MKRARLAVLATAALALAAAGMVGPSPAAAQKDTYKVFVSVGFEGNTWMDAAQNLIRSMAKTKAFKDRVELNMQSARADIQTQIQQVNAMLQGDADIIILWPNSRTALNRSIRQACQRGIIVMTFDASVTEPCAYHIGLDQTWAGAGPAEYLAEELGGKGRHHRHGRLRRALYRPRPHGRRQGGLRPVSRHQHPGSRLQQLEQRPRQAGADQARRHPRLGQHRRAVDPGGLLHVLADPGRGRPGGPAQALRRQRHQRPPHRDRRARHGAGLRWA